MPGREATEMEQIALYVDFYPRNSQQPEGEEEWSENFLLPTREELGYINCAEEDLSRVVIVDI